MHGYIYVYICIYMYVYIYVCIYAYAHMYIYISTTRACAPVQQCSSFPAMKTVANLSWVLREHRAGCRFRPPSCPFVEPAALLLASCPTCLLKKSVQIHASSWRGRYCSVAQASSDHPRWCGPHPVCLWFTLAHGRGSHPRQKFIFAAIFAGSCMSFLSYVCVAQVDAPRCIFIMYMFVCLFVMYAGLFCLMCFLLWVCVARVDAPRRKFILYTFVCLFCRVYRSLLSYVFSVMCVCCASRCSLSCFCYVTYFCVSLLSCIQVSFAYSYVTYA